MFGKLYWRTKPGNEKNKEYTKKWILSLLGSVVITRQYNSPNSNCSPSIIIQGNVHLPKYHRERFEEKLILF